MRSLPLLVAVLVGSVLGPSTLRAAYTPESPEVKGAVARAVEFLEKTDDHRLGAKALCARVLIYLGKREHPRIDEAVAAAQRELAGGGDRETQVYSLGLAIAMLAELDAPEHRELLQGLVDMLVGQQKPHGGWGYPSQPTGDTSMTQYAIYGLWNARQVGVQVDEKVWAKAVDWLLRTQDRSGAWGYQGVVALGSEPAPQTEIRRSMCEAALVSLYLGGEHFEVWSFRKARPTISTALRPVVETNVPSKPTPFDVRRFRAAIGAGQAWDAASKEPIYADFPCYHLYTIERYHTFRNAAQLRDDPDVWYDQGVEFLLKSQTPAGGWQAPEGPVAATGFAALFLLRSTRTAIREIERMGGGTLVGGRGLPIAPRVEPSSKRPSAATTGSPTDGLADLLRKLDDPQFLSTLSAAESIERQVDLPPPTELRKRLIALAKSDSAVEQAAALSALARTRDLDHVPLLIESLRDGRPQVHQAAVDALRFMARRSEEVGRPLPADEPSRLAEASRWREWYLTIRPPAK